MISSALYQELVPDAPRHRRTDRDSSKASFWKARLETDAFLKLKSKTLKTPELLSTYRGRIDALLFAFPAFALDEPEAVAAYKSLIAAFRNGTRFTVAHHPGGQSIIEDWYRSGGHDLANVTFVEMPEYVQFTDWAEDAYVSLRDRDTGLHYLVEPWEFRRAGDALIADAVEGVTETIATQAPLVFQGGNCLITDGYWLIGKDYFVDSVKLVQGPRPPVLAPAGAEIGKFVTRLFEAHVDATRELLVVGTDKALAVPDIRGVAEGGAYYLDLPSGGLGTFQPIFHIDMFLTPLSAGPSGKLRFLVGDPSLADRLLGTTSPYGLSIVYDRLAADLEAEGFEVIRNPLVHRASLGRRYSLKQLADEATKPGNEDLLTVVKDLRAAGAREGDLVTVREWHHITWNNCLVESSAVVGDHVYMPTFGHGDYAALRVLDDHMAALWEGLGFQVHRLGDFNSFAARQGVVHCIKKYLARSD